MEQPSVRDGILDGEERNCDNAACQLQLPREQIEAFCVRHHIRKLSRCSVRCLTERFGPESDCGCAGGVRTRSSALAISASQAWSELSEFGRQCWRRSAALGLVARPKKTRHVSASAGRKRRGGRKLGNRARCPTRDWMAAKRTHPR